MRRTSLVLAVLLAAAGICVMLWPVVTGYRLQANTDEAVQSFLEERKPEQQHTELLAALQEYNRQLYAEKQCNLTDLEVFRSFCSLFKSFQSRRFNIPFKLLLLRCFNIFRNINLRRSVCGFKRQCFLQ